MGLIAGGLLGRVWCALCSIVLLTAIEIIVKMVKKGRKVNCLVFLRDMKEKSLDALEFFFEKATLEDHSIDRILEDAQKPEIKEVMSVVKAGVVKRKKRQAKWWQFWK